MYKVTARLRKKNNPKWMKGDNDSFDKGLKGAGNPK